MPRPFLKICGLRRLYDLFCALDQGARFVGMIVDVPYSPRSLPLEQAARLASYTPGRVVAVVRDLSEARLREVVEAVEPVAVQLHGQEPPELVAALRVAFPGVAAWRVLGVPPQAADWGAEVELLLGETAEYAAAGASAVVLDTRLPAGSGGTGKCCDWEVAAQVVRGAQIPVILAGGLSPDNLVSAAHAVAPAGLDVSSGIEESPGVKSLGKMGRLFQTWKSLPE